MKPWIVLDRTQTPDGANEITLHQRDSEFSIQVNGQELMSSRMHGSEMLMAELTCAEIANRKNATVLVGGLGMGFTLAETLRFLQTDATVVLAELVPAVVEWNRGVLGPLAGNPLQDARVEVRIEDVGQIIAYGVNAFDAILLDVDNGPDSFTQEENTALYNAEGLARIHRALRPGGILSVWSAGPDRGFSQRLKKASFKTQEKTVRARAVKKGPQHTIWIAAKKGR